MTRLIRTLPTKPFHEDVVERHQHTHAHASGTVGATVDTTETETNTAYDDMATVGPSIEVVVGSSGMVLVGIHAGLDNSGANNTLMGFAATGANTIAANDGNAILNHGTDERLLSGVFLLTGLNAGATTLTAKYRVSGGTGTIRLRRIWASPS